MKTVYIASAMFNDRENLVNTLVAEKFEESGFKVFLPVRDGFVFSHLAESVSKLVGSDRVESIVQNIIYLLDIGHFVNKSDFIIANLDEPIDPGVVIEMVYAKLSGKSVISFRTDVRSPYGNSNDIFGGAHFFPIFQSDVHIHVKSSGKTSRELSESIEHLVMNSIDQISTLENNSENNSNLIEKVNSYAKVLFDGVENIHSNEGLEEISKRYLEIEKELSTIRPFSVNV